MDVWCNCDFLLAWCHLIIFALNLNGQISALVPGIYLFVSHQVYIVKFALLCFNLEISPKPLLNPQSLLYFITLLNTLLASYIDPGTDLMLMPLGLQTDNTVL